MAIGVFSEPTTIAVAAGCRGERASVPRRVDPDETPGARWTIREDGYALPWRADPLGVIPAPGAEG
jgi:hypothetical protein